VNEFAHGLHFLLFVKPLYLLGVLIQVFGNEHEQALENSIVAAGNVLYVGKVNHIETV
jgi:hypothetical protein